MSRPIISFKNVSKRYLLGATAGHDTLRDQLAGVGGWLKRRARGSSGPKSSTMTELWALQDVSLDIQPGEVVGIIGRNGAGKSTMLKVLSQITEPTQGEIHVRGRMASLLEVGTGFHQELTGRENIFLNGAILGMSRSEIQRKFDEIVAFAEVDKFLDTPVKRYSSGMYVRLAFAVAAHLEPEILLVDEVLAVGDATFQNKCLGKMEDVAQRSGRTVLFVSHNMSAVQTLCGRIVHLSQGRVRGVGPADEQIRAYLADMQQVHSGCELMNQKLGPDLELRRLQLSPNPVVTGQDLEYTLEIVASRATTLVEFQLLLHSVYGARVAMIDLRGPGGAGHLLQAGQVIRFRGRIRHLPLVEGDYRAGVFYHSTGHYGDLLDLVTLTVDGAPAVDGRVPYKPVHRGVLNLDAPFEVETGPA